MKNLFTTSTGGASDGTETGTSDAYPLGANERAAVVIDNEGDATVKCQRQTSFGSSEIWVDVPDASGTTEFTSSTTFNIESGGASINIRFNITAYTSGTVRAGVE